MTTNRQITLKSRPEGWVGEENFELTEAAMPEPTGDEMQIAGIDTDEKSDSDNANNKYRYKLMSASAVLL